MGMCIKGVDAGQNEDGMEVDGSTNTIGGVAGDDAGRCDGRGAVGWEVIMTHTITRYMSLLAITKMIKSAPHVPCRMARRSLRRGASLARLGPKATGFFGWCHAKGA